MLRCKTSYADIATIEDVKLVGNSLIAWPTSLKNCLRIPHPRRYAKPFLRDKIVCRWSGGHIGSVQNNLNIGSYEGKHVALLRASDTVLDCGQGTMIDFPSWKAFREMLAIKIPEVTISLRMLLRVAEEAEEEVDKGLAEEVKLDKAVADRKVAGGDADKVVGAEAHEALADRKVAGGDADKAIGRKEETPVKRRRAAEAEIITESCGAVVDQEDQTPVKRPRTAKAEIDTEAWRGVELGEYPNEIHEVVTNINSDLYRQLIREAEVATCVAYDAQWSTYLDPSSSDNPITLLQLAFPITGNTYVLQLPMLAGWPPEVQRLFESKEVAVVGFAANEIDVQKFEISGVKINQETLIDVQPWCEAEMGENESAEQGRRVGLKQAAWCVLDFDMEKTSNVAAPLVLEDLTTAQVECAAMDVWVALRLYQRLAPVYHKTAAAV